MNSYQNRSFHIIATIEDAVKDLEKEEAYTYASKFRTS